MRKYRKFSPGKFADDLGTDTDTVDDNSSMFEPDLYLNVNNYKKDLILTSIKLKQLKTLFYSKSTCSTVSKTSMSSMSSLTPPNTPSSKYTKNPSTISHNSQSNVTRILANESVAVPPTAKSTHYIQQPKNFTVRSSLSSPSLNSSLFEENNTLTLNLSDDSGEWVTTRL
jgi:hypothetical protein